MFNRRSTRSTILALAAPVVVSASVLVAAPSLANSPSPEELVAPADLPGALPPEPRVLGPGVGSEEGLQVKTVLAKRSVNALFPAVNTIVGVRPDAKPWHPSGRAIDVMIPNHASPEGIALGDAIRDFALRNAGELGVQDVIWRGTYYTPAGPGGSGYGHYDHVHITTVGGGLADVNAEYILVGR